MSRGNRGVAQAMDFFAAQDFARKRTRWLVWGFGLTVVLVSLALFYVVAFVCALFEWTPQGGGSAFTDWRLFAGSLTGVGLIMGGASLSKMLELRSGGAAVAQMLGGRLVTRESPNMEERQFLNIVEEMSIASGVPFPEVFVLEHEQGINAFAAGFTIDDAAIGVTRGALEQLNRDELQGVVAHEFSHILNGDMRLNIRMLGILYGLFVIKIIGRGALEAGLAAMQGSRYRMGSRRNEGGGGLFIISIGFMVMCVGALGGFLGRLIQGAVSREREYLADAAAVQFTRNPHGIACALMKVGGGFRRLNSMHAEDVGHMFFANCLNPSLLESFATHPPLKKRIKAILPEWDGKFIRHEPGARPTEKKRPPAKATQERPATGGLVALAALQIMQIDLARELRTRLNTQFGVELASPPGTIAVLAAIFLDANEDTRRGQNAVLKNELDEAERAVCERVIQRLGQLGREHYLSLLEFTLPSLLRLDVAARGRMLGIAEKLVSVDGDVSLFECAGLTALKRHVQRREAANVSTEASPLTFNQVKPEIEALLSHLAWLDLSATDSDAAQARFRAALLHLANDQLEWALLSQEQSASRALDMEAILGRLQRLRLVTRRDLLNAAFACVAHDHKISPAEGVALRALALALECPLPHFNAGPLGS